MTIRWEAASATHRGRVRRGNEDSIRLEVDLGIFIVADGMGGHAAGEVASRLASEAALETLVGSDVRDADSAALLTAFTRAHEKLISCCHEDPTTKGMGTTLTIATLRHDGALLVGHLGDSRLYHLHCGELRQLTKDHTWVRQEVDAGRIRPEAARSHALSHILTRVLTAEGPVEPDLISGTVAGGDLLLLCSDGLHNMVDDQELLRRLLMPASPSKLVAELVSAANRAGGSDNVSAIVISVLPGDG